MTTSPAQQYMASRDTAEKSEIRSKAKYRFIEFLRPDGYWPQPYRIEQAFGVFGWLIESGQRFKRRGQWGEHTIECLLSKKGSCTGIRTIDHIESIDDLRERFHHAFFGNYSPIAAAWRKAAGINAYGSKVIAFPHYEFGKHYHSEISLKGGIDKLIQASGQLAVQLNSFHDDARVIQGVEITYCSYDHGWRFRLMYGCQDGGTWFHDLASQRKGEPFVDTFLRAQAELEKLKGGA